MNDSNQLLQKSKILRQTPIPINFVPSKIKFLVHLVFLIILSGFIAIVWHLALSLFLAMLGLMLLIKEYFETPPSFYLYDYDGQTLSNERLKFKIYRVAPWLSSVSINGKHYWIWFDHFSHETHQQFKRFLLRQPKLKAMQSF